MNILLVYPNSPNTFWSFKKVLKFMSKKTVHPPLGLLTVSPMLPKEWNKKLIDCNVSDLTIEHIKWADKVLISAMIVQLDHAQKIIKLCKENGKTVIAGGPGFTTGHENIKGVDHLILNEAEVTLPMFLKDLEQGEPKPIYTSMDRPDITKTPIPDWSLININDYATMAIQYSRGCPFNCEFCDIVIMNGRISRTKKVGQILDEFQSLYDVGWRGQIFIVDDNFIGNKSVVKNMLSSLIVWQKRHKYPFRLLTEASINLAEDKELMQMMSAANFYSVFIGIESPSVNSLLECGKAQNSNIDVSKAVRTIHRNGMLVLGGFIVGFDNDTDKIFDAQLKFIQEMGVVTAMVGILNALPQTRLWHRLKSEGRLLKETTGENTDGTTNFIPKMGKEKLMEGYKNLLSKIYSNKNYYKRIDVLLKDYRPKFKSKLHKAEFMAFVRSFWVIGVLSKSRFLFWRLMIKTLFTKTKSLPASVQLSIQGIHFESIAKQLN